MTTAGPGPTGNQSTPPTPGGVDSERERYERARKRVNEIRDFYTHLMIYLLVNAVLFVIDLLTRDGWWFFWPLLGWGVGVGAHAITVFAGGGMFGPDWERRKVRELVERERRRPR